MHIKNSTKSLMRAAVFVLTMCMVATLFVGCDDGVTNAKYRQINASPLDTKVLAANSDYELSWDKDANAVLLRSVNTGKVWSNILYDAYLEGSTSANANSGLLINVANTKTLKFDTIRSYSEIPSNGSVVCKEIENGIRVTYFFDLYEIAVPIDYVLRNDSVCVSVNTAQILENGTNYKLLSVSLAPFMCSVKNDSQNGFLFVPSGSGAVMTSAKTADGTRKFVGEVYGADAARQVPRNIVEEEGIKLPVFGAADTDSAMLAVIEQGAGAVEIEAQAGNERLGYSNIMANAYVRGYDEFLFAKQGATQKTVTTRVSDNISGNTISVGFYPLYGDNASLTGMAKRYREYLIENENLTKNESLNSPYSVTIVGGTNVTDSILGIPNRELVTATTFEESEKIIDQLIKTNGVAPVVRMLGFGDSGLFPGKIAGGNNFDKVYGEKKDLDSLQNFCLDNNTHIFFDSEIVYFSKSGVGFSKNIDSALTAINKRIVHYPVSPIKIYDKARGYSVVSRDKLQNAADLALKKAQKFNNKAVSLSSLGYTAFSDNAGQEYYNKHGIEADVQSIISNFKKSGIKTAVANANAYAACVSDLVFDVTDSDGGYDVFDYEVPFYQMVFHGYKDMYTQPINLSQNFERALAKAAAFGMGLGFAVTNRFVDNSDELGLYDFYGMVYEDNDELISELLCNSSYADVYLAVKDAEILEYALLQDGITRTDYSNGVSVYVNHTDKASYCSAGELKAYGFMMKQGA